MRWLEEFELKHVDFVRCIKSFEKMRSVWLDLAGSASLPGDSAFARKQASTYYVLHRDASAWFLKTAEPRFLSMTEETLVETISDFRAQELSWLESYGVCWYGYFVLPCSILDSFTIDRTISFVLSLSRDRPDGSFHARSRRLVSYGGYSD